MSSSSFQRRQHLRIDRHRTRLGHRICCFLRARGVMLRITVEPDIDRISLKLEGDLSGTWVAEVEESWLAAYSMRGDRELYLDLTGVQHVGRAGRYLLGRLPCRRTHLMPSARGI